MYMASGCVKPFREKGQAPLSAECEEGHVEPGADGHREHHLALPELEGHRHGRADERRHEVCAGRQRRAQAVDDEQPEHGGAEPLAEVGDERRRRPVGTEDEERQKARQHHAGDGEQDRERQLDGRQVHASFLRRATRLIRMPPIAGSMKFSAPQATSARRETPRPISEPAWRRSVRQFSAKIAANMAVMMNSTPARSTCASAWAQTLPIAVPVSQ